MRLALAKLAVALVALVALLVLAGCEGTLPEPRLTTAERFALYTRAFAKAEPAALSPLAWQDPRMVARLPRGASLTVAPDGLSAWEQGAGDPFQFDLRSKVLDFVEESLRFLFLRSPLPQHSAHALEQELLVRFLGSERVRIASERELPRSASALLAAMAGETRAEPAAYAKRVAWRLENVRAALVPFSLSAMEGAELAEALAAIDRAFGRSPVVSRALSRTQATLDRLELAPFVDDSWTTLDPASRAHLGVSIDPDREPARLARTIEQLRVPIEAARSTLSPVHYEEARKRAAAIVTSSGACALPGVAVVRALGTPPERTKICIWLHALGATTRDTDEVAALMALHDGAVVASWAIAMRGRVRDPREARRSASLVSAVDPASETRLLRGAAIHPLRALGLGVAAELLVAEGTGKVRSRAQAWFAFGDAPLDIVERELFTPSAAPASHGLQPHIGFDRR